MLQSELHFTHTYARGHAPLHRGTAALGAECGWARMGVSTGEPAAIRNMDEMKGKRMNHSVSGETHESYIVSADLTDSTRISLPEDPQFQVPETPLCRGARCEPWWGGSPGRSLPALPPVPAPRCHPGSPLHPDMGKLSSSSRRCRTRTWRR